eukprot:7205757-Prymnesium_polylepis.1
MQAAARPWDSRGLTRRISRRGITRTDARNAARVRVGRPRRRGDGRRFRVNTAGARAAAGTDTRA